MPDFPQQDHALFDHPIFEDPDARALSRVGVVDVGSNSVRLVVFDGAARSPAYFYNEKIMCALGAGIAETGTLSPKGRERAFAAIARFAQIARTMQVNELTAVATAAVREASDGPEFCAQVQQETDVTIHVIDGAEEARLSAQGVLTGWPGAYGLICDIGGASMELAEINDGQVGRRVTSPLGPLKLRDVKGGKKGRRAFINETLDQLYAQMGNQRNRLFLVGGSWRAIARIDMERQNYPLKVLHEYRMTATSVRDTARYIQEQDPDELRARCGVSGSRMALVPLAIEVLKGVLRRFKPHDIAISSYGIREGVLYEQMSDRIRERDPLIEACRFMEAKDARIPGFGKALYKFIFPIFKSARPEKLRLIKAACLLHDVSWRAHPDYRAETVFDSTTRANLGGLKHSERLFLGLSLLHRYRNKAEGTRFEELAALLSDKDRHHAEVIGKAMRFGAMLWQEDSDNMGTLRYHPKKAELHLKLPTSTGALYGEVAEARFNALATALNATPSVRVKD
ncbi:Ppx/GppA family phosphatase [Shimia marina]|uniref:Guanosine-5'-triphosphate,3'-diphosphate pyrophosphatase n=1 Tax=Shimia marina TaxID=321267 RepID=A0A0P1ERE2_9RHOB|nr:Ppx/GppA family phosphatase [Shimia marina]CUH52823.1 Guanosine-5'-triphosphate,3'-diphosphate pyrophosphatase [Shimia marina]SFD88382.1 exopolyphosphatase / guanosine-5'-triphosphate,3'-diphosphate pyrophosphatase [Shimia marina]